MKFKTFITSHRDKSKIKSPLTPKERRFAKLTKDGLIFKSDLMDVDTTSQTPARRDLTQRP